jgi:hypothetical protein
MPLHGDGLKKVRGMVETAVRGLGGDPEKAAVGPDSWVVGRNSAAVLVRIVPQDDPEKPAHLQLVSPVMRAPAAPAFRERLLALNYEMGGLASFCLTPAGEAHLFCSRTTDGISASEIAHLIAQVAHFSDLYDDQLLAEFGREHALSSKAAKAARA